MALPPANMISTAMSSSITIMGSNHHFLRWRRNCHNSFRNSMMVNIGKRDLSVILNFSVAMSLEEDTAQTVQQIFLLASVQYT